MALTSTSARNTRRRDSSIQKQRLAKVQIAIGNYSLSFRWIPDDGMFGGMWVGTAPVTQGVYKKIMSENPSRFINDNAPIEMVSFWESIQFCRELSEYLSMDCGFLFSNPDETSSEKDFNFDDDTTIIRVENSKTSQNEENRKKSSARKRKGRVSLFSGKKKEQRERIEINEHTNIALANKGFRLLSLDEWMYVARCNRKFIYSGSNFSHRVNMDTRRIHNKRRMSEDYILMVGDFMI